MVSKLSDLVTELKRRKALRVGGAYVVVGVGVLGAAEVILDPLGLGAVRPFVVVLVLLGLPLALVLAWAYELRPEEVRAQKRYPGAPSESRPPLDPRRIAVLPFSNISPDPGDEYLTDGMTEEIISVLSRIRDLEVIARTSVMQYKGERKGVAQISQELGVGTVLEGSIRKADDQLRVTVQLIDCSTEGHLWVEDYDREYREVFDIQRDVARHVATALQLQLLAGDARRIEKTPTDRLEAYDLYLLGRFQVNRRTDESIRRAIGHFERAIEIDPHFALAYAGLAESLGWAVMGYCPDPPSDALRGSERNARKAVELDDQLPEAHVALSFALLNAWEFDSAEREAKRAIDLNPGFAEAYQRHAYCLLYAGRFEESLVAFDRALELDPRSVPLITESGWPLGYMGEHDKGLERYYRAIQLDPEFALAHFDIAWSYQRKGMFDEARAAAEKALVLSGRASLGLAWYATLHAETNEEEKAREMLAELQARQATGEKVCAFIALVCEALGEPESAFEWLERSYEDREPTLAWILVSSELGFRSIRSEKRFIDLQGRIRGKA